MQVATGSDSGATGNVYIPLSTAKSRFSVGPYCFSESLGRGSNTGYGITFAQIEGDRPVSIKHAAQKMGEEMFSKLRGEPAVGPASVDDQRD